MSVLDDQSGSVLREFKINHEYLRPFIRFQNLDVLYYSTKAVCRDMVSDQLTLADNDMHVSITVAFATR